MKVTSQDIKNLLAEQLQVWDLARNNYDALHGVETKEIFFGDYAINVQFNPARIQSSAAKVDAKSIQERKCFLCPANLPAVQKGLPFGNEYQILVNPFPIFPQHFTIPSYQHVDQLILNRYADMLDLAESLDEYTIFYNGPKCGASAPDHVHFQAGNKHFMPIEEDMQRIAKDIIYEANGLTVYSIKDYLRNGLFMVSHRKDKAVQFFTRLYLLLEMKEDDKEPMMNIITWYEDNTWYTSITLREKHRPACYAAEGDSNILVSPGSVDLGGVFIMPLEKDFRKITPDDVSHILREVCISDQKLDVLVDKIRKL